MDDTSPNEPPPTFTDIAVGLMITSGFMLLLTAIPLGLLLPWRISRDSGWDITWTVILGVTLATGIAVTGGLLLFLARVICRFRWGFWADVFWPSEKNENSQKPCSSLQRTAKKEAKCIATWNSTARRAGRNAQIL